MDIENHYYFEGRKNIRIVHSYGCQFSVLCDFIYDKETIYYTYSGKRVEHSEYVDESGYEPMYYPSLVTLRVDLFTFLNKNFGTNYEVTEEMRAYADSFRGKLQDLYNIGIEVGWEFSKYGRFEHCYRYTGDGASLGVCRSTYDGCNYWTKEEFIALADALVEFFAQDPLQMARKAMQEKYDFYNEIGVGHKEDPTYTGGDCVVEIPPRGASKISQTSLQ